MTHIPTFYFSTVTYNYKTALNGPKLQIFVLYQILYIYVLIQAKCASARAWVELWKSINFNNKVCHLVSTTVVQCITVSGTTWTFVTRKWQFVHVWQPNRQEQILLLLDDLLTFYEAFCMNLMSYFCYCRGMPV